MYQHKRKPLNPEEASRLAQACKTASEKIVVFTLLDTGLRVSELANLKKDSILRQERQLIVYGKGKPSSKKTKRRIVPLTERSFTVLSSFFALEDRITYTSRAVQKIVKRVAGRAGISKTVSPQALRYTFASACMKRGVNKKALQQLLGQTRLITTDINLNQSPEEACHEFTQNF